MDSLRALGLVGQDVQEEQDNVVNYEIYLQPEGVQHPAQRILGHPCQHVRMQFLSDALPVGCNLHICSS